MIFNPLTTSIFNSGLLLLLKSLTTKFFRGDEHQPAGWQVKPFGFSDT